MFMLKNHKVNQIIEATFKMKYLSCNEEEWRKYFFPAIRDPLSSLLSQFVLRILEFCLKKSISNFLIFIMDFFRVKFVAMS